MNKICMIHIGKTAGTNLTALLPTLNNTSPRYRVSIYGHDLNLSRARLVFPFRRFGFFIREPISRARSGFYDRLRKSGPFYNYEWNKDEARVFERFHKFDELAIALSSLDPQERHLAKLAFRRVRHLKWDYPHYLRSAQYLERVRPQLFFIGEQENYSSDVECLAQKLCAGASNDLSNLHLDAVHSAPASTTKKLSLVGKRNLEIELSEDFEIYRWCKKNKLKINRGIEQ